MSDSQKNKFATEMDYDEFVKWATEYVVEDFLESGLKGIRRSIFMIINQAAANEVFGGKSPKKK